MIHFPKNVQSPSNLDKKEWQDWKKRKITDHSSSFFLLDLKKIAQNDFIVSLNLSNFKDSNIETFTTLCPLQPIVKSCLTLEESLSMMEKCIVAPAMANSLVPKDMDLAVGLERFPWMMAKAIRYKYPISQPQKHRNFNHFKKYFWRMSLHNEFFTNHSGQK